MKLSASAAAVPQSTQTIRLRAADHQRMQRRTVGAVAFHHAVRHVMQHLAAEMTQQRHHQRSTARAIHIVVAEHTDHLAVLHRMRQTVGGDIHVDQYRRIGQQRAQRGVEEVARRIHVDATRGEQTADDFGQAHALGDAETDAVLTSAPNPAPSAQAAGDAEDAVTHEDATTDEHR